MQAVLDSHDLAVYGSNFAIFLLKDFKISNKFLAKEIAKTPLETLPSQNTMTRIRNKILN